MKLPSIEIKKPGSKATTNKKDKRKISDLNDLSCSFDLDEPEKAIKLDNDRTHVNNNIFAKNKSNGNRPIKCAQETCDGAFKSEIELNKHISRCHSDNFTIK